MGCNMTKCSECPKRVKACQLVKLPKGTRVCSGCYEKYKAVK